LPRWGAEERIEGTLTAEELNQELKKGRAAVEARYRHRILTVTGRVLRKQGREVVRKVFPWTINLPGLR
jgi:hypothetical protein